MIDKSVIKKMPLGYMVVTAYVATLLFAFLSQWFGVTQVEGFVARYQTLIVGLPAIAAVMVTLQQLRHERQRDGIALILSYEREMDALSEARELVAVDQLRPYAKVTAALLHRRSGMLEDMRPSQQWSRLREATQFSVARRIDDYAQAVDELNVAIRLADGATGPLDEHERSVIASLEEWQEKKATELREEIDNRLASINTIIELSSRPAAGS